MTGRIRGVMAGQLLVDLEHAGRRFGNLTAVDDLTLALRRGEILGLYGPSGSGKSTTIRMILGIHRPTSGMVRVLGVPAHRLGAREREQIGYSPQSFLYPPTFSAEEAVSFAAGLYGKGWLWRRRAVRSMLERVELWDKRRHAVGTMSGGERRRVANAAALVHAPRLAILDEPTTGLDPLLRGRMWDWFRALRNEGRTLLTTGHNMAEAESCDRVALLVEGRLRALGTPAELRRQALGGEIVEVAVEGSLAPAIDALRQSDVIREVAVRGRDHLWLTVDSAGVALPLVVERLRQSNVAVTTANEVRPPFDDVFERLVTGRA
ncbi:MAG: ABC transporter ATP-binding protein [Chloroflexota bacterium]